MSIFLRHTFDEIYENLFGLSERFINAIECLADAQSRLAKSQEEMTELAKQNSRTTGAFIKKATQIQEKAVNALEKTTATPVKEGACPVCQEESRCAGWCYTKKYP